MNFTIEIGHRSADPAGKHACYYIAAPECNPSDRYDVAELADAPHSWLCWAPRAARVTYEGDSLESILRQITSSYEASE